MGEGFPNWPRFKDRNAPPHILGEIKEHLSVEVLNAYDAKYAEVMKVRLITKSTLAITTHEALRHRNI